jgi:hypothetical protein
MVTSDDEMNVIVQRIGRFQAQLTHLRKMETNADNFHAAASGFLAEIDCMQLEVREYLSTHPTELAVSA